MASKKAVSKSTKRKLFSEYKCDVCPKRFSNRANLKNHSYTHTNDRPYVCPHCTHTSKTKKYLAKHIKKVHGPRTEECDVCGKMFHYKCLLKKHMMIHTGEKPYKCNVCKKSFNTGYSLKTHKLIHAGSKPFKCTFCDYSCRDSSTLRKHEERHMGIKKSYECKICNKCYKTKRILKYHISEVHLGMDLKNTPCPICSKTFKSLERRNTHIKVVHDRIYSCKCDICGVVISNKYMMASHLTTHSDYKPFLCSFQNCGKRFKDKSTLKKHTVIHYPEQHHPCPKCGKLFVRICRLKKHSLQHKEKTKCVFCDYCGKGFYNKNYLANHIRKKHEMKLHFICDICGLLTYNKPSIVMHLKYGHVNEHDRKCKICKKKFKEHKYLKQHYWATHCIKYKVIQRGTRRNVTQVGGGDKTGTARNREPELQVKEEVGEYKEIELLHEVKVERVSGDENNYDKPVEYSKPVMCEAALSEAIIPSDQTNLRQLDQFFIEHITKPTDRVEELPKDFEIDEDCQKEAQKHIKRLLARARRKMELKELERTRRMYNKRMREAAVKNGTKVKYIKINKTDKDDNNDKAGDARADAIDDDTKSIESRDDDGEEDDNCDAGVNGSTKNKFKINTHQCYVCFKLYETKEKLLKHCQEHFDVCNSTILKKCPLCDYVTKLNIARHLRNVHSVNVKITTSMKDNKNNNDGSRFYYNINSKKIDKIEVIPSVKSLNKQAYMNIDKRRKEINSKRIQKTKLVKKDGEWIVEKHNINVNGYIVPKIDDVLNVGSNDYFGRLKRLSVIARNEGRKIMYPCEKCEKICQTLSALKLHSRKHEANPKPFKPKVWKHKMKTGKSVTEKPMPSENRYEKPKPIVSKHKCDPKLKEFYENNIKGGDVEFWHFLKIFNRMSKQNINDFDDLEKRTEFGIHFKDKDQIIEEPKDVHKMGKGNKENAKARKKLSFIRTILISKREHHRRKIMKQKLRENLDKQFD